MDNTTLFVEDEHSENIALNVIENFGITSGLKLVLDK